ncbi:non-ribosomal peptide synthetase [Calothrix sp. NIES-2098]|uniref:non-ribosomal peptide synthetase n=1 Tax=Calothrix sp. NIES-2098 TaxID=1954171 RepID=UPI000B5E3F09|nr:amino acid adenylation domain-containing protein [Calothrix sp. NIES-2098]
MVLNFVSDNNIQELNNSGSNIYWAVRLSGYLKVDILQQALNAIASHHPPLRSHFNEEDTQSVELKAIDLQKYLATESELQVKRFLQQESQRSFDSASNLMLRACLLQLNEQEQILLLVTHPKASLPMNMLWEELAHVYQALLEGKLHPLSQLPNQYTDNNVGQDHLNYWKKQLAGAVPVLELPSDRPRPPIQAYQGARKSMVLPQELTKSLKHLCGQQKVNLFMTLLAAYQTLLYRYSSQEDILVGSATRGYYSESIDTLIFRTHLSDHLTFIELLDRVRSVVLDAHTHENLPFEQLLKELKIESSPSYHPLFQVMFNFQEQHQQISQLPGVTATPIGLEIGLTKLDLIITVREENETLLGIWEYNTDLFDDATISRMVRHFQNLLAGIVAHPSQQISLLPLLSADEQQQLLNQWQHTQVDYPYDSCIHKLFEAQVELVPDAVAVVYENQQLTYRELNIKANQVAHYLQNLGVGSDVLVGICVERSLEMIIGLLGILKAGGAYVPLDPNYPVERLAFILEDAQVSVLLTQERLLEHLPQNQAQVLCLDREILATYSSENPTISVTSANLAYIIYTSGSTGKPKGVLINHSNVVRLFNATEHWYHFNQEDVWTLFHSFAFDFSVWEIWGALIYGGRLVLVPYLVSRSPEAFYELLCQEKVTVLNQTPSAFQQLIRTEQTIANSGELALRWVIFGGEALELQSLKPWFDRHGDESPRLVNMYGITETTVHVTYRPITTADLIEGAGSVIGCPIPDLQVYVLDRHRQLQPIGVPGEMYVGGAGLARGYLNRPDLTAKAFISNPFSNDPQARLYKTGDLARYLPNGDLEYLGRIDHQVKIRGFRIELGEIEAILNQHPTVQQTVAIAREDVPGDKRLVAYIVPKTSTIQIPELRRFLKEKLPEHMIPAAFVMLDVLPLTSNGKVDRRALPVPDASSVSSSADYVAPRNPTEEILATIWAQILGLERVGINDNFFELGGHSLLATQVISRLRQALKVEIALRSLFAHPTIAELAQVVDEYQSKDSNFQLQRITALTNSDSLPLSFAQQRMWFWEQLQPGSSIYHLPEVRELKGDLNITALQQSLDAIVARHEALRTNYIVQDGNPVQAIQLPRAVELLRFNLQDIPESDRSTQIEQILQQQTQRPFDFASDLMLRGCLLQVNEQEHILLLVMHHIASDGWSMNILWQELADLYLAFVSGQPNPLVELPIQYADYAVWQRQWLEGEVLETQLNYWQQQLAGAPPVLELPTDRPRPPIQTYQGAGQSFTLSGELSQALQKLSRQEGVTLFMTLLAAFQTLLYRYSRQEDILVGSAIAGRNHPEIEGLIGFFVNTLVMRTDMSGNPSFRELLRRVRQVASSAYAHQDLPFEKLVEQLQIERSLSYHPLFQVMFILQNTPNQDLQLPGLSAVPLEIDSDKAAFDLILEMFETPTGIKGKIQYNTELFDAAAIARTIEHLQTLLAGIVAHPEQNIATLPLLTASEQHQLLRQWNDTQVDYPQQCIHLLIEQQVERTPDAVAVVFHHQQLTYQELNQRANQLAHHLQNLGVGPEVLVGICVERSLEMVVGMLAVLKAGAAYVPLDPAYPQERLAFMMSDAQVQVLLTQEQLLTILPKHQATVICLDTGWKEISQYPQSQPVSNVQLSNLAYIIYTSGSTGKPKGVLVTHKGLCTLALAQIKKFSVQPSSRILQFASFSFDASIADVLMALCAGARLCLAKKEALLPGADLMQTINEYQISHVALPPSALAAMSNQSLKSLQAIIVAGEACKTELAAEWSSRVRFFNAYGPTESTVCATMAEYTDANQKLTIGRPIANSQIYILDTHLQPVPIGVAGEVHIGGIGLARGYLNRPELTKEKFIPNPFSKKIGSRLYKTGDLARYLPDGNIEFLGRIDDQVKIRGFRIELGEIEATLAQHPLVQQAVVTVREDIPGDKRLVAYIVAQSQPAPTTSEWRSFLKQSLPDYTIPNAFVVLETLPLTPNGKVNRRALPEPDTESVNLATDYVAPSTPTQEAIAAIWKQVLGVEKIGINDNFFDLGGHSLLATQAISYIRQAFQLEIALQSLFAQPTIAQLAQFIDQQAQNTQQLQQIPKANRESIPLSFAQQRVWFLEQLEPNSSAYIIIDAQRLQGKLNIEILQQSLDAVVAQHEALRTTFIPGDDGSPIQVINPPRPVELKIIDLRSHSQPIEQVLNQEALQPFNLASDLMVRATLVQIDTEEQILLLTMHHIASDGWSIDIFWQQLTAVYAALLQGRPSPLEPLPIQYADFAVWQREYLSGEVLQTELDFWKNQLAGAPTVLELPADRPRSPIQTYRGASQALSLSSTLSAALTTLSRQQGVTLFMTLLAAFGSLLHRYTGQSDILIGSPIAGRNRAEIEQLIGFFINTVVLRTKFADDPSFTELLAQVRDVALAAYDHQDLPFEKLVEELHVERDTSRNPIFQVWFNMLNLGDRQIELPGLNVESVSSVEAPSKFDLTLYVLEQQQGIQLQLVYNADLFNAERMQEMLRQFQHLLTQIVAIPQQSISSYSLVTPTSQALLPQPRVILPQPDYELVTTAFTAWVNRSPEHTALRQSDRHWSYQELGDRATNIAQTLVAIGVKPGDAIAIFGTKSFGLIASTIGILLSGGVLLTIDPQLPSYRQELMLQAAQAKYLIYIDGEYPEASELWQSLTLIYVDSHLGKVINPSLDDNREVELPQIQPDDAAYIFFTSGTTGVPKGVLGCHKGLAHFLTWQRQTFNIGQQDRVAQLTGLSFDVVLRDIFLPLTSGATLCLPEPGDNLDPTKILHYLEQEEISVMHTVPSLAESWLVNVPADVSLQNLRWLFFAGEPLKQILIEQWRKAFPTSGEIVNLYGPTETTLAKCYYRIPEEATSGVQPIGLPLPQTQALVLTSHHQLCGIGELGEIVIRTPFRTKGYINATAENLARFVKNPLSDDEQDWLYYTGDRGRYRPDGLLEILGRQDHQIKIRGIRIEPGEIESVLTQHPEVLQAVVIAREDIPGDKRLVAYITAKDAAPSISDLRRFLSSKLPQYMIPSAFVLLDTLPLTPNGKVDRRALPAPELSRQEPEATFVAPRNQVENQLVEIWQQVLAVESIGVRDSFFELGGHSLLAVKLFWQIEQTFGQRLPLASLFQSATIETLAEIISPQAEQKQETSPTTWSSLVPIQPHGSKPPLFCVHGLGGEVLCFRELAMYLGTDQPFYGLQPQGLDGEQPPLNKIEDMAAHYIREIQTLQPQGPYYLAGYSFGGNVAFEMAQQLHRQGEKVGMLVLLDTSRPGSENRLPLIQRIGEHLQNLVQIGPSYLWHRMGVWRDWILSNLNESKSRLNKKYKNYLDVEPDYVSKLTQNMSEADHYLEIIDANAEAISQYSFRVYPGRAVLLRTDDRSRVDAIGIQYDPQFGWGELVAGGLDMEYIPGSHFDFLNEPHVRFVAQKLRHFLSKAMEV